MEGTQVSVDRRVDKQQWSGHAMQDTQHGKEGNTGPRCSIGEP